MMAYCSFVVNLLIHLVFFVSYALSSEASLQSCNEGQIIQHGNLKYLCQNNTLKPSACVLFENGKSVEIPINSSEVVDGFWRKCIVTDTSIQIIREPRCLIEDKSYHVNETFKFNSVIYRCTGGSIEPIGCTFRDSKNQEFEAKLGETYLLDNVQRRCIFSDSLQEPYNVTCHVDGKVYNVGEKIELKKEFLHECTKEGFITVSDCKIDTETAVKIGQSLVKGGFLHKCIKIGNGVRYIADPCGPSGNCPGAINLGAKNNDSRPIPTSSDSVCHFEGKTIPAGEKYQSSKGFIYVCNNDGSLAISECVVSPGVTVKVNQNLVLNNRLHKCVRVGETGVSYSVEPCGSQGCGIVQLPNNNTGPGQLVSPGSQVTCTHDNVVKNVGSIWVASGFKLICNKDGNVGFLACVTDDGREIAVGENRDFGPNRYSCTQNGDTVSLSTTKKCTTKTCNSN